MILVDTSAWVQFLRTGSPRLTNLLEESRVVLHPFVIGELALGHLENRHEILALLDNLPSVGAARHAEVLTLIEERELSGSGIGWVDAHLLAASLLHEVPLWTLDRRLAAVADDLGVSPW